MDDQREKHPRPEPDSPTTDGEASPGASSIPEEADEIIEILDDSDSAPDPASTAQAPPAPKPAFSQEAMQQIRSLQAKLDTKDKQIEQVMEAYRSKKSETEKLRKRIEKTERRRFEQSKGDFIARFVEVLDNLDRAIDSIEDSFDADSVLQGIMLVRSRLVQLLKEEGLEKIFVRGQAFDPAHSEAAGMESVSDESEDGVVLKELQPGYMLKGSLLRAARVVVGRFGGEGQAEGETLSLDTSTEPAPSTPPGAAGGANGSPGEEDDWEADAPTGHKLEFSEDGFDFSND